MKDLDKKIVAALFPLLGMLLGFLVYTFGLGGWRYTFTGRSRSWWIGPWGLLLFVAVGGVLGWLSYRHRDREIGGVGPLAHDAPTGFLLGKRLIVIATCLVGIYFVWQLARSVF